MSVNSLFSTKQNYLEDTEGTHSPSVTFNNWGRKVIVAVQLLSHVPLFATPWTAALQVSLSFIISWNLAQIHVP